MKKLTLVLTLTLVTLVSSAQLTKLTSRAKEIKVGQIAPMGVFIAELTYNTNSTLGDTIYTLTFRNAKYTTLDDFESIEFKADTETINTLYTLFADAFTSDDIKNYEQTISLGDNVVKITGYKAMGIKGVQFYTANKASVVSFMRPINKAQLDNLFGKNLK
jgi:hypothetical protein